MAKRRGFFKKARRYGRRFKSVVRRSAKSQSFNMMDGATAFGYGAIRPAVATLIQPLTSKIPVGDYSDEVGLALVSLVAYKYGSGLVKKAGRVGLTVELAAIGGQTLGPMVSGVGASASNAMGLGDWNN